MMIRINVLDTFVTLCFIFLVMGCIKLWFEKYQSDITKKS